MLRRRLAWYWIASSLGASILAVGPHAPSRDAPAQPMVPAGQCDCCEADPVQGGCSDPACESLVCSALPACCVFPWVQNCAELASQICDCCDCNSNGIPDADETIVEFRDHPLPWNISNGSSAFPADLDGDGDLDMLYGSPVNWKENLGSGIFGPDQPIGFGKPVAAGDLNGDGYNDVVQFTSGHWYENLDGQGNFGSSNPFPSCVGSNFVSGVEIKDLDGDGDNDVFAFTNSGDSIFWFRNLDGLATFEPCQVIATVADLNSARLADVDGDEDLDILSAGDEAIWFENLDGLGTFGPAAIISPSGATDLWAADLDGDQDYDILSVFGAKVSWYENQGNDLWPEQTIDLAAQNTRAVRAADLDQDGDPDVVVASLQAVRWYENEGAGTFGPQQNIPQGALGVGVADLDGDGDADLYSFDTDNNFFHWFENQRDDCNSNGFPDECEDPAVALACVDNDHDGLNALEDCDDAAPWCGSDCIDADLDGFCAGLDCEDSNPHCTTLCTDADGDGYCVTSDCDEGAANCNAECIDADQDGVRVCDGDCDDSIFSCGAVDCDQDCDANGLADACDVEVHFTEHEIGFVSGVGPPAVVDLDGDGDNDVVLRNKVSENLDGLGDFSAPQSIPGILSGRTLPADVDLDGDVDLIVQTSYAIYWYENMDGLGQSFGPGQLIEFSDSCEQCACCSYGITQTGDMDGDSDPDLILGQVSQFPFGAGAFWIENRVREGLGWEDRDTLGGLYMIWGVVADMDGDQDDDYLHELIGCDFKRIAWDENTDGLGNFGASHTIENFPLSGDCEQVVFPKTFGLAVDFDGDGDLDVLGEGSWYENLDGLGNFGPAQGTFDEGHPRTAADMDNDSDADLVATYFWYENLDGSGTFSAGYPIEASFLVSTTLPAILDGDGDVDVLMHRGSGTLVWYDNLRADCNLNTIPDGCEDPGVGLACTDLDLDGVNAVDDCDDANPACTNDCTDNDGDGFCVETDCDDTNPGCTASCLDVDSDGYCAGQDCAPAYAATHPGAEEINDGVDNQCPGFAGHGLIDEISTQTGFTDPDNKDLYSWPPQVGATHYEVSRADTADFTTGCTLFPLVTNVLIDTDQPITGAAFYYLARAAAPNVGSWGADSDGTDRIVPCASF